MEVLEHFVDVYREKLHLQPLPLFSLESLPTALSSGPQFLLWSFLSLILTMTSHAFYRDKDLEARNFYASSAEGVVQKLTFEGVPSLDIIQSLCLLALKHINGTVSCLIIMAVWAYR